MSALHDRITEQDYLKMPDYHPAGSKDTPMIMPVMHVRYADETVLYGNFEPLVTADGAVVPASADVRYPTVVPAGRP